MSLSIQTGAQGDRTFVVALRGEVDYASAQQFREAVSAVLGTGSVRTIVVDLAGVTFLDSTGVGTLVVARRICEELGVRLDIVRANAFILRLFGVLGVSAALGIPAPPVFVPDGGRVPRARSGDPLPQTA